MHEGIVIAFLQLSEYVWHACSISSIKREACLLVIQNYFMYFLLKRFKHLAQCSLKLINNLGTVNSVYYIPSVFKAPTLLQEYKEFQLVFKSSTWHFLETLFRHHLALLLPFLLAILVPRCKLICVCSLVLVSNLTICVCFIYAMWQWLIVSGFRLCLQLLPILFLGPVLQLLLVLRFAWRMLWQTGSRSVVFVIYRWSLAVFFGTGLCITMYSYFHSGKYFIYMTHWGFTLCSVTSITGAILATIYHTDPQNFRSHTKLTRFYWACYWTNLVCANVITALFWICIYPTDIGRAKLAHKMHVYYIINMWTHAMPTICYTVDHMLVAQPARLWHVAYPFGFGMIYLGFSIIYHLCEGNDVYDRPFIYEILNYSKPGHAAKTVGLFIGLQVVFSCLQYGVYRLRVFLARKLGKSIE